MRKYVGLSGVDPIARWGLDESARKKGAVPSVHTSWFLSNLSHTSKKNEENCSSDKGMEFILMRSRTATR